MIPNLPQVQGCKKNTHLPELHNRVAKRFDAKNRAVDNNNIDSIDIFATSFLKQKAFIFTIRKFTYTYTRTKIMFKIDYFDMSKTHA